jgi:hypothetical protein
MDTALLAFDVDGLHQGRLMRPFDALAWMEALESELARLLWDNGVKSSSFKKTPLDDVREPSPHSAFFFPISHDARRARLDQVLVHAPRGFEVEACDALHKLRQIKGPFGLATVILVDLGYKAEFADRVDHFRQSQVWRSVTPVIPFQVAPDLAGPSLERQVRNELILHGFPPCSQIDVSVDRGRFLAIDQFERMSSKSSEFDLTPDSIRSAIAASNRDESASAPPVFGLRLKFDQMVQGPLALGRWSRHGMGQFLPV